MVVIVATLKAKSGKENELIAVMTDLAKSVRSKEPGTLEYTFHRSQKDAAVFMVYEKYKDGEAVKAHMASPHFQDAGKKMGGLLEGGLGIETYAVIE